jgi:IclR family KDG regulon transcriptional repressor
MRMPISAGVAGKALLSLLPEDEIDKILSQIKPKRYTPRTIVEKAVYKKEILNVKKSGIAYDKEEYIEGLIAVAVPLHTHREGLYATIWAVGLKQEFREDGMSRIAKSLTNIAGEINYRFSVSAGAFGPKNGTLNA